MNIDIQTQTFSLSDELRQYVSHRLAFALSSHDEYINLIEVRLNDLNGPKGGKDMCCQIRVVLFNMSDVIIRDVESELRTAIDRACDRAGRTVSRQIERRLTKARQFDTEVKNSSVSH